jgi:hypothetical protein
MPFVFQIDTETNLVRETWTGRVDLQQMKESCLQEWAHREYKQRMPLISDFRQATSTITPQDMVQFALWFGDKDPPSKHAIVVTREAGFGFAKMFALMSDAAKQEPDTTRVFYSHDEAEAWIAASAKS